MTTDKTISLETIDIEGTNYVDLFDEYTVEIKNQKITLKDHLSIIGGIILFATILVGILIEESPESVYEYAIIGMVMVIFMGMIMGYLSYLPKLKDTYYATYKGFYKNNSKIFYPWAQIKTIVTDFFGYKFITMKGESIRIYTDKVDDYYRFNMFLKNLIWINRQHNLSGPSFYDSIASQVDKGVFFGKTMRYDLREHITRTLIHYTVYLTVFFVVCAIFVYFAWQTQGDLPFGGYKLLVLGGLAIVPLIYLVYLYFADDTYRDAQEIHVNSNYLDITYGNGERQKVSWQKVNDLFQNYEYKENGDLYYSIYHSTDGGVLLIDLLPLLAYRYDPDHSLYDDNDEDHD